MTEPILTRSLWPQATPRSPLDVQLERLLDGLKPGQEKARFAGWGREMRQLYRRVDPEVFRGAVTRYLALEEELPRPAAFAPYVSLAEAALERQRREAEAEQLPPPPPLTEEEQRAKAAATRAAIEEARAKLPPHLRKPWSRR